MGPVLLGAVVDRGRCCRVAEWPASVEWWFSDIGNWFPDIGKSNSFPDIGKSIPNIRKSFPDIGKFIISRYWKLISRYRELEFLISGNNSRYREMLNKNPNGFPYKSGPGFSIVLPQVSQLLVCLWLHGNCLNHQRLGNGGILVKHDQKLIRPEESHYESTHQIWVHYD